MTNRLLYALALVAITFTLSGCASDPLTSTLKKYDYAVAMPAPESMYIGDTYETADVRTLPYLLIGEKGTELEDKIGRIMQRAANRASMMSVSSERLLDIGADVDLIGRAKLELANHGITKFRVKFGKVTQYVVSKTRFVEEIYPVIKREYPGVSFDKKYAIWALLKVDALEYEFYDRDGTPVALDSNITRVLNHKTGIAWTVSKNQTLCISSPRFIGYRMCYIKENRGGVPTVEIRDASRGGAPTAADPSAEMALPRAEFEEISCEALREAAR